MIQNRVLNYVFDMRMILLFNTICECESFNRDDKINMIKYAIWYSLLVFEID